MEAIRALQRQLQEVQATSGARKFSERSCIDLVQKLVETDRVKLIHTASGKEWLTPEQLDREIRDVLAANGGRVSVTELPAELGVAIEHCEQRADHIVRRDGSVSRMHSELLTSHYVQNVAEEVAESLEQEGFVPVAELATRYNLPADFVRESVLAKVTVDHVVKQNAIYTGAYAARVEAVVRGALRGCTQPVLLSQLSARHSLTDADMVATFVQKMIRDGVVQGKLQGSTFTPKVFSEAQASRVDNFFGANQYLTAALAKSSGVVIKDWAKARDGILLKSAFLAAPLVDAALASITEALGSDSWIDAQPLLPPAFTAVDATEFVDHLAQAGRLGANAVVLDRFILSGRFVQAVAEAPELQQEVQRAAEASLSTKGTKKGAGGGADADEDGGGGKKKGKRAPKGKKGRAADEDDAAEGGEDGGAGAGDAAVDGEAILGVLAERFPDVPDELYDPLCAKVQSQLASKVTAALEGLRETLQTKRKTTFETAEKLVQERYEKLAFGLRALEATKLQETPLYQHLIREVVAEPLHAMIALRWEEVFGSSTDVTAANRRQCLDKVIAKEGAAKLEAVSRLLSAIGKSYKEASQLGESTSKGSKAEKTAPAKEKGARRKKRGDDDDADEVEDRKKGKRGDDDADEDEQRSMTLVEMYHAAADDCHIYCRKVDKKREKSALQEQKVACKELLRDTPVTDIAQVCLVGIRAAVLQTGVPGLILPGEPWAMRLVTARLPDEAVRAEAAALCEALATRAASADGGASSAEGAAAPASDADAAAQARGRSLAEDPVALEAAAGAWRDRMLGSAGK
eukprot:TRINITY_DN9998_c0_g5_i1.p1 TRINITY_DN9998_c0_g5~~TRINITY_DN9998_c0_g5_i1.p1  ORF type:complete len:804 (-),score=245.63 TRINITY_DN9998_c0_g5_i1:72-2483(-)